MHSIMGGWILFLFLVSEQATLINKNMTKTQSHFINKKKKNGDHDQIRLDIL